MGLAALRGWPGISLPNNLSGTFISLLSYDCRSPEFFNEEQQGLSEPQAECMCYGLQHSAVKSCLIRLNQAGLTPSVLVCARTRDKSSVSLING